MCYVLYALDQSTIFNTMRDKFLSNIYSALVDMGHARVHTHEHIENTVVASVAVSVREMAST